MLIFADWRAAGVGRSSSMVRAGRRAALRRFRAAQGRRAERALARWRRLISSRHCDCAAVGAGLWQWQAAPSAATHPGASTCPQSGQVRCPAGHCPPRDRRKAVTRAPARPSCFRQVEVGQFWPAAFGGSVTGRSIVGVLWLCCT